MRFPEIIFEDKDLIVINKPAGLLSIPAREGAEISVKSWLQNRLGAIYTVHRLDKETSGIMVFARNEETHRHLSLQFENRQTEKIYLGLVHGSPAEKKGMIDIPLMAHPSRNGTMVAAKKGKDSLTEYEVLGEWGLYSWLKFRLHTGRTHQIRVHMKYLSHPLVCDELYGTGEPFFLSSVKTKFRLSKDQLEERPLLSRLALHASALQFSGPGGQILKYEAPLPKDLKAVLQQLNKWK